MRAWAWVAAAVVLLVVAASCIGRAPSPPGAPAAAAPAADPQPTPNAPSPPQPPDNQAAEGKTHEVILEHAERVRYDNKTKEYLLTGEVVLRHEDGVLRAQTVRMNSETKQGTASGDLSFADEQTVITADRLEIDFDARLALFKGSVRLVTRKKSEAQAAPAEPAEEPAEPAEEAPPEDEEVRPFREYWEERTEIRCPELEYSYRDHRAHARGGVTARQKDHTGRADEAIYDDEDELLILSGNVELHNQRGESFRARRITISVAEDWLEAEGVVESRFLVEEEEEEPAAEEPAAEPSAPPEA